MGLATALAVAGCGIVVGDELEGLGPRVDAAITESGSEDSAPETPEAPPCSAVFFGLPPAALGACRAHWSARGQGLRTLSAYAIDGAPLLAGAFAPGPDREASMGLGRAQLDTEITKQRAAGFRPLQISPVVSGASVTFAALFTKADKPELEWLVGVVRSELDVRGAEVGSKGFGTDIYVAYEQGGGFYTGAVWSKHVIDAKVLGPVSVADFKRWHADLLKDGFQPVQITPTRPTIGGTHYCGVYNATPLVRDMLIEATPTVFLAEHAAKTDAGRKLEFLSVAGPSSPPTVAALWVAE